MWNLKKKKKNEKIKKKISQKSKSTCSIFNDHFSSPFTMKNAEKTP